MSGLTSSCCAPVLFAAVTLTTLSPTILQALIVSFAYVLGIVFPLFIMSIFYQSTAANAGLNTSNGFYNVSLVVGMEYLLFILGNDSSTYYGGYFNQTAIGLSGEVHRNLSLVPVLGHFNRTAGIVPGNLTRLRVVDTTGSPVNNPFLLVDSNTNGTRIFFNLMQVGSNSNEYAFYDSTLRNHW